MKEFIKIGDYYVKDAQARAGIEEVQERIDNLPSGSGALPEVSEADNGKVLQVVDGKWKVVNAFSNYTGDYTDIL